MLYMVEMDLPDRARLAQWHDWYLRHIQKLLAVDGFHGSQRFEALTLRAAPFLAIHDVDGPELFDRRPYRAVGGPSGTGAWREIMTHWSRNLFDGCNAMPEIGCDEKLVIVDDPSKLPAADVDRVAWLSSIGLDRTIAQRGFFILAADEDHAKPAAAGLDVFKPLTGKLRSAHSGL